MAADTPTEPVPPAPPQAAPSAPTPGPMIVPGAGGRGVTGPLGWIVMGAVVLIALVIYVATRAAAPGVPSDAPAPTWGTLTLSRVALNAARADGEPHPTHGLWVATQRMYALPYLTGTASDSGEAEYVVAMQGRFHTAAHALPGSRRGGSHLFLLVRGFDGQVDGALVTDRGYDLKQLGPVHPLWLGLHLF